MKTFILKLKSLINIKLYRVSKTVQAKSYGKNTFHLCRFNNN